MPWAPGHPKQHRSFRSGPCGTMLILVQRSVQRWKRQMLCDFGCFHSEIPQERMKTVKLELIKKWASRYPCQISPNKAPTFDMTRLHTTSLESLIFLKRNLITFPLFQEGFGQNRQATVDAKQQNSCDLHDFFRHMR